MPRKTYPLTDETYRVISGNEQAMAREMECDPSYFHHIKRSEEPDRYPPFREQFRAGAYANAPVEIWLNDLNAILLKAKISRAEAPITQKILDKIQDDSQALQTIVEAARDGHFDKSECHKVLAALAKNAETNKQIEEQMLIRLAEIGEKEREK